MFRFTIRDLLWLMVVVGLALGWWGDHIKESVERRRWKDRAEDLKILAEMNGHEVEFDDGPHNVTGMAPAGTKEKIAELNRQADAEQAAKEKSSEEN
jgi:hypothetical protein